MLVSLNEIKKLVQIPSGVSTDELVKLIGSRLVEVEGTIDLSKKYKGIKIVEVVECEKLVNVIHALLPTLKLPHQQLKNVHVGFPIPVL